MKLTYKALTIFSFLIVLIIAAGAFNYKLVDSIEQINQSDVPSIQCLNKLENIIRESAYSINTYRITGFAQYKNYFDEKNASIDTLLLLFQRYSDHQKDFSFLNKFDSMYQQLESDFDASIMLTQQQKNLEKELFTWVDKSDDIIDFDIQAILDNKYDRNSFNKERSIREIEVSVWEAIHAAIQHLAVSGGDNTEKTLVGGVETFEDIMQRQFNDVRIFLAKYKSNKLNASEKAAIEKFEQLWNEAMNVAELLLKVNVESEEKYKNLNKLVLQLNNLIEQHITDVLQVEINNKNEAAQLYLMLINIMIALGVFILVFIVYFLVYSITKPINALSEGFSALGQGELNTRIDFQSGDEMQELADNFNRMAGNLEKITVSKTYVDNIVGSMLNMLIVLDTEHKIVRTNKFVNQLLGFSHTEMIGSNFNDYYISKQIKLHNDTTTETYFKTKDNATMPVLFNQSALKDKNGLIIGYVCIAQDMTRFKAIEAERNNIEIQKTQTEKKRAEERGILLKEIHHRVKNNLQIITSLLDLQAHTIDNSEVQDLFKQSQYRINSMAIIHEMLYQTEDFTQINFGKYIEKLVDDLIISYKGKNHQIQSNINLNNSRFSVDTAIPLGLIINEIVSNSMKHGFKNQEKGRIDILIEKVDKEYHHLYIGDNGQGVPEQINFNTKKSLGLKLIHSLSRQLYGGIEVDKSKQGVNFILRFKEI